MKWQGARGGESTTAIAAAAVFAAALTLLKVLDRAALTGNLSKDFQQYQRHMLALQRRPETIHSCTAELYNQACYSSTCAAAPLPSEHQHGIAALLSSLQVESIE